MAGTLRSASTRRSRATASPGHEILSGDPLPAHGACRLLSTSAGRPRGAGHLCSQLFGWIFWDIIHPGPGPGVAIPILSL